MPSIIARIRRVRAHRTASLWSPAAPLPVPPLSAAGVSPAIVSEGFKGVLAMDTPDWDVFTQHGTITHRWRVLDPTGVVLTDEVTTSGQLLNGLEQAIPSGVAWLYLEMQDNQDEWHPAGTHELEVTVLPSPSLTLPADSADNQALDVTFSWSAISGNSLDPSLTYRLQVASDSNFDTIVYDNTAANTSRSATGLLNGETYWWRIAAVNYGYRGAWATKRSFGTIAAAATVWDDPFDSLTAAELLSDYDDGPVTWAKHVGDSNWADQKISSGADAVRIANANKHGVYQASTSPTGTDYTLEVWLQPLVHATGDKGGASFNIKAGDSDFGYVRFDYDTNTWELGWYDESESPEEQSLDTLDIGGPWNSGEKKVTITVNNTTVSVVTPDGNLSASTPVALQGGGGVGTYQYSTGSTGGNNGILINRMRLAE